MLILADSGPVHQQVFAAPDGSFRWLDVVAPDRAILHSLIEQVGLPESAAEDCLDTHALPKFERYGAQGFLVVRFHVGSTAESAASAYDLTLPLYVLLRSDLLLTIHRRDNAVLARLRARYEDAGTNATISDVFSELIRDAVQTFQQPLERLREDLITFEESLLSAQVTERGLEQVFIRKRRASALGWMLLRTREAITRAHSNALGGATLDEAREVLDTLQFRARELADYTESLLNLQIAIASHRTNEVMRVLTVMSAIFMPLTFIAGVYGMNFDAPEFHWRFGYLGIWIVIAIIFFGVLGWFRTRGWLR